MGYMKMSCFMQLGNEAKETFTTDKVFYDSINALETKGVLANNFTPITHNTQLITHNS